MKIAIVVQGRFHAFDLARALLRRGHDVTVLTNYPKWAVARFGVPADCVRSFWPHGVASRAADRVSDLTGARYERWLNPLFGRWASRELARHRWDVIHAWSGILEEIYDAGRNGQALNLIMRGSAHIRVQARLLLEEERRTGIRLPGPDPWIVAREEREYELADRIVTLSRFARDSFVAQGVRPEKLRLLPLGADTRMFRADRAAIEARCARILAGETLKVLYVGALSLRKGLWDSRTIVRRLRDRFDFRFVGPRSREVRELAIGLAEVAEVVPKQPHLELRRWYEQSDLFMFPTVEDGFAVVLAQAHANALPVLTTPNCGGPDLIRDGESGWVLPIREPEAFVRRLLWCDAHRVELAAMVRRLHERGRVRTWDDVAADFEAICVSDSPALTSQGTFAP